MRDADLEAVFRPGSRVFVPGSSGEPAGLVRWLEADPERTRGVSLTTSFVPGINRLDVDALDPSAVVTGLFMAPHLRAAQASGRYRHLPVSYGAYQLSIERDAGFDVVVVQVAPTDDAGWCSLGPAAEFTPAAAGRARRLVGVVNARTPRLSRGPAIHRGRFDLLIEGEGDLPVYDPGAPDPAAEAIARYVGAFIEDGVVLQLGLGKTPAALTATLKDRRGLRLHSGLLSDGVLDLAEAGALDPDWRHLGCVLAGSAALYRRAADCDLIHVEGCEVTHAPQVLATLDRFIAVNSALEVDLFGQCNLECAGGRAVSGPGGAPDFARAARMSRGGASIIALPASARGGSRIVSRLSSPGLASLSRTEVDIVVTEHGAADLRGLSTHERAERLISLADPAFRRALAADWAGIASGL